MNVPNHSQTSRIRFDIQALQNGQTPSDWRGNSYAGIVGYATENGRLYTLIHWQTPIAQIHVKDGVATILFFDARHISTTTRGFQGRIIRALSTALGMRNPDVERIHAELGRKTSDRRALQLHPEIAV